MKAFLKKLRNLVCREFNEFKDLFYRRYLKSSSQYYEDLIIDRLLNHKKNGIYLDIGANDPDILSNTKRFYDRGWSGVNIEPDTELYNKLLKHRSRDINLNIGISSGGGELVFYKLSPDTLSTFSKEEADRHLEEGYEILSIQKVSVAPLAGIFEEYLGDRYVDFMSVDVEGFDLDVLKSNNWVCFRPSLIIVEINREKESIVDYMRGCNYSLVYENHTNGIFADQLSG